MLTRHYLPKPISKTIAEVVDKILDLTHTRTKNLPYSSNLWQVLARRIKARDQYRCRSCGSNRHLDVHHMVPIKFGGDNSLANLHTLCRTCHSARHPEHRKEKYGHANNDINNSTVGLPDLRQLLSDDPNGQTAQGN